MGSQERGYSRTRETGRPRSLEAASFWVSCHLGRPSRLQKGIALVEMRGYLEPDAHARTLLDFRGRNVSARHLGKELRLSNARDEDGLVGWC